MATYHKAPASADEMIQIADRLMYEVKDAGKNELMHLIVPDELSKGLNLSNEVL